MRILLQNLQHDIPVKRNTHATWQQLLCYVIDVIEMSNDPLLSELWLVALSSLVNGCPPRILEDIAAVVAVRGLLMRIESDDPPVS